MALEKTGREWRWSFRGLTTQDVGDFTDYITGLTVELTLVDYDKDLKQANSWRLDWEPPETVGPSESVAYDDITPEMLRDWLLGHYAVPDMGWPHGIAKWLEKEKKKIVDELEKRANTRNRRVRAEIIEEQDV
jgi:hypothetical protein